MSDLKSQWLGDIDGSKEVANNFVCNENFVYNLCWPIVIEILREIFFFRVLWRLDSVESKLCLFKNTRTLEIILYDMVQPPGDQKSPLNFQTLAQTHHKAFNRVDKMAIGLQLANLIKTI